MLLGLKQPSLSSSYLQDSLVPRSHPREWKKGSGEFGHGPGKEIWALQWDCSFSVVIWLTNRRNAKRRCLLYKFESSARTQPCPWPIRYKVCFVTAVSAHTHRVGQTKETIQIHQTPFPLFGRHDKEQTSLLTSLEARWPASWNTQHLVPFIRECVSMATVIYAHGTTILINREPSEPVI